MTNECAWRCSNLCTTAERGADGVRQTPRHDQCTPSGLNRSTVLRSRFAKVSGKTSGGLECRSTEPATGFSELIGEPFGRPQDLPPAVAYDQQTIEQSKRDCRHDEEVHCNNAKRMVAKERLPSLRGRAPPPHHILGDARLADLDAELEKLSMDSRRSPQRVGDAHLADQPANFQQYSWSTAAVPGFPAPIRSETGTMPTDDGMGFTIV